MKNTARLPRDRFLLFHCPRVHRCKLSIHDSEFQVRKLRSPFFFLLSRLSRSSCNRKCTHARRAHHRRGETFPIIRLVRVCLIYVYVSLRVFSLRATYTHIYTRVTRFKRRGTRGYRLLHNHKRRNVISDKG